MRDCLQFSGWPVDDRCIFGDLVRELRQKWLSKGRTRREVECSRPSGGVMVRYAQRMAQAAGSLGMVPCSRGVRSCCSLPNRWEAVASSVRIAWMSPWAVHICGNAGAMARELTEGGVVRGVGWPFGCAGRPGRLSVGALIWGPWRNGQSRRAFDLRPPRWGRACGLAEGGKAP